MTDLISRQAAIEALSNMMDIDGFRDGWAVSRANVNCMLRSLPSAQPDHIAEGGKKVSFSCGHENDLISRQAAVDALRYAELGCELEAIEKLPSAQPEQRWIPVSKRLPNGQTEVIVSCRDDSADTIYRYTASGWTTTDGEYWIVDNEINHYVIAWMPLPEPWKDGEADE